MTITEIKTADIKPYARNAKRHPEEQVKIIAESIKQFGWAQPIVVDEKHEILIGHGRLLAAKKLGLETAPCYIINGLNAEQKRKLRLIDNKSNESEWDFDFLSDEIADLDFDGFDIDWGLPEENSGNALNIDIAEKFGVIVECSNEQEQEEVYNEMSEKYICRILT